MFSNHRLRKYLFLLHCTAMQKGNLSKSKAQRRKNEALRKIHDLSYGSHQIVGNAYTRSPIMSVKNPQHPQRKSKRIDSIRMMSPPEIKERRLRNKSSELQPMRQAKTPAMRTIYASRMVRLFKVPSTIGVYELTPNQVLTSWHFEELSQGQVITEMIQRPSLSLAFNPLDVKQGRLGDCYFVATLAALASCPHVLQARIPAPHDFDPSQRSVTVYMFESGKSIEVKVENIFPKIYCQPVGNNITPMVLEKAYAQVYGGFRDIVKGYSCDAMRDLTGAPTVSLWINNVKVLKQGLKEAFTHRQPVTIASKKKAKDGVSSGHCYTVMGCRVLKGQLFLQIRDPRGKSKAEIPVPEQMQNQERGVFWAGEQALKRSFYVVRVSKVTPGFHYYFRTFSEFDLIHETAAVLIQPSEPVKAYLSIHQKHRKFHEEKFPYDVIRLLLAQVEVVQGRIRIVRTIKVIHNSHQVCWCECKLQARSYILLGQIGTKRAKDFYPRQVFTLSVYCQNKPINFSQVSERIDPTPYLISFMLANKGRFRGKKSDKYLIKYKGSLFGYICIYYQNQSHRELIEENEYQTRNVEVSEQHIRLRPNEKRLVMHRIGPGNNCSHKFNMKSRVVYK